MSQIKTLFKRRWGKVIVRKGKAKYSEEREKVKKTSVGCHKNGDTWL